MVGLLALLLAGCGAGGWATYSETTADDGDMGGLFDDLGGMDLGGMDLGGMAPDFMGAGMDAFGGGMPRLLAPPPPMAPAPAVAVTGP
jgi:hypothetical protein